jgi:hypothetical protein
MRWRAKLTVVSTKISIYSGYNVMHETRFIVSRGLQELCAGMEEVGIGCAWSPAPPVVTVQTEVDDAWIFPRRKSIVVWS